MEPNQSGTDEPAHRSVAPRETWALPLLLLLLLAMLVGFAKWVGIASSVDAPSPAAKQAEWAPSPRPAGKTVSLEIDFGNGAKKEFEALPWQTEMTVANLLDAAQKFKPGLEFVHLGHGETGFLVSLDGLANEGADGRNWIYQVGGKHAHQSFCLEKIEPGTHVLWTFTDELYNSEPAVK